MHLAKLHGLGNDFLVLIDLDEVTPDRRRLAAALCDRRRGIGADGLIRVTPGPTGPTSRWCCATPTAAWPR
jgi:diaminopimelate epimerase